MTSAEFVTKAQFDAKTDSISRHITELANGHKEVRKFLFGNGEPGIDEKLRIISDWVTEQKLREKQAWSDAKKFGIGMLAFIVNTLLAIWIARMIP